MTYFRQVAWSVALVAMGAFTVGTASAGRGS
jgi:hypothetical protein